MAVQHGEEHGVARLGRQRAQHRRGLALQLVAGLRRQAHRERLRTEPVASRGAVVQHEALVHQRAREADRRGLVQAQPMADLAHAQPARTHAREQAQHREAAAQRLRAGGLGALRLGRR